jgi:hypothetical protein
MQSATTTRTIALFLASLAALACCDAVAQQGSLLSPDQAALYDKMPLHEQAVSKALLDRQPVVEIYMQGTRPDPQLVEVPSGDEYLLTRVELGRKQKDSGEFYKTKEMKSSQTAKGAMAKINKLLGLNDGNSGYSSMILPSIAGSMDRKDNQVSFLGHQFLGQVKTSVFLITPKKKEGFLGQVWLDEQDGYMVRFNGIFQGHPNFHLDSWRLNVEPGLWLPSYVYLEDTSPLGADHHHFHAQSRIWGYSLKASAALSDNESVTIDDVKDASDQSVDLSPLEAKREFTRQSESNIVARLYQAGLLAGPSDFDKILETVTNNLIIGANLPLEGVQCRVLLTTPLESLTAGNTIILSKGLIDTLPSEEALAMVISFQLAHISLGHQIESRFGFSDAMFFNDNEAYTHIPMAHSAADNAAAAQKALEILKSSVYKDKLQNAALYLNELQVRSAPLASLVHPRLGDGFFTTDSERNLWMASIGALSPAINNNDLHQITALPLNSQIKVNSWDDTVQQLAVKPAVFRSASDKLPFELTPVFIRLTRATAPAKSIAADSATTTAAAATGAPATPPSSTPQ